MLTTARKSLTLAFILSMPGRKSWDGKWSGESRLYCIVKTFRGNRNTAKYSELDGKSFSYSFGDGWRARVEVKAVDAPEARSLRRRSRGFCGYDWMVDSIMRNGHITLE